MSIWEKRQITIAFLKKTFYDTYFMESTHVLLFTR